MLVKIVFGRLLYQIGMFGPLELEDTDNAGSYVTCGIVKGLRRFAR
jgi:hypothetical protein